MTLATQHVLRVSTVLENRLYNGFADQAECSLAEIFVYVYILFTQYHQEAQIGVQF